jgi:hypothetical protein
MKYSLAGLVADHKDIGLDHRIIGTVLLREKPDIQGGGKNFAGFIMEKIGKLPINFSAYTLVFCRGGSHHKDLAVDDLVPFGTFPFKVAGIGKTAVFG